MKPLEGIRIIDMSTFVAGPGCARLLADMGAEVIKIEPPMGDGWRVTGMTYQRRFNMDQNPIFDIYNSGKKWISINLKSDEGQAVFHKLLESADVFITNNRESALKKLKCSYEDLKEKYPRLIYAWTSGYGSKGPEASRPAFDTTTFWPRCGFLMGQSLCNENGDFQPVAAPSGVGDTVTSLILLGEINAALLQREKTGRGQFVESNLFHAGLYTMGCMIISKQGTDFKPMKRSETGAFTGRFKCKDGNYIYIPGAIVAKLPYDLATVLGWPERGDEFKRDRFVRVKELYKEISEQFMTQDAAYWLARAREVDLPMERLARYQDVVEDEQAWANDFLENVEFADGGKNVMPRSPIHMENVGMVDTIPAPQIGTDTETVLKNIGYSEEEIRTLTENGAVICKGNDKD